jgi:hypothetical protein
MAGWSSGRSDEKKAPGVTWPPGQVRLIAVLPTREFDAQQVLNRMGDWSRRNHAAYVSPRTRRLTQRRQLGKVSL